MTPYMIMLFCMYFLEGTCPTPHAIITGYLTGSLPPTVTVEDPSLSVLALLRIVQVLNRYWHSLYEVGN